MSLKAQDPHIEKEPAGIGRRRFLNAAAALGIGSVALAGCKEESKPARVARPQVVPHRPMAPRPRTRVVPAPCSIPPDSSTPTTACGVPATPVTPA